MKIRLYVSKKSAAIERKESSLDCKEGHTKKIKCACFFICLFVPGSKKTFVIFFLTDGNRPWRIRIRCQW